MLGGDQADRAVGELETRLGAFRRQPVLHVRNGRIRHEQRPGDFQERGRLDDLHVPPQMACVVPQIPIPAAARPCLELHGQRRSRPPLIARSDLLQQRLEHDIDRRCDVFLLGHLERVHRLFRRAHHHRPSSFSLDRLVLRVDRSAILRSACSLIRSSWWVQKRSYVFTQSCTGFNSFAFRRYRRRWPCLLTDTIPTLRSTPRCFDTAGCGIRSLPTTSPTACARPSTSTPMIARRRGSEIALKASVVVAARAIPHIIFLYGNVSRNNVPSLLVPPVGEPGRGGGRRRPILRLSAE